MIKTRFTREHLSALNINKHGIYAFFDRDTSYVGLLLQYTYVNLDTAMDRDYSLSLSLSLYLCVCVCVCVCICGMRVIVNLKYLDYVGNQLF